MNNIERIKSLINNKRGLVLVAFRSSTNFNCKLLSQRIKEQLKKRTIEIEYVEYDVEEVTGIRDAFYIKNIPTFNLYYFGKLLASVDPESQDIDCNDWLEKNIVN